MPGIADQLRHFDSKIGLIFGNKETQSSPRISPASRLVALRIPLGSNSTFYQSQLTERSHSLGQCEEWNSMNSGQLRDERSRLFGLEKIYGGSSKLAGRIVETVRSSVLYPAGLVAEIS